MCVAWCTLINKLGGQGHSLSCFFPLSLPPHSCRPHLGKGCLQGMDKVVILCRPQECLVAPCRGLVVLLEPGTRRDRSTLSSPMKRPSQVVSQHMPVIDPLAQHVSQVPIARCSCWPDRGGQPDRTAIVKIQCETADRDCPPLARALDDGSAVAIPPVSGTRDRPTSHKSHPATIFREFSCGVPYYSL